MKIFNLFIIALIFFGCANKFNLDDYKSIKVKKNPYAPKYLTFHREKRVLIINFPSLSYKGKELSQLATNQLKVNLSQSKYIKVYKVIPKSKINEYVKLVKVKKDGRNNKINYYIIEGSIQSITYTPTYHEKQIIKTKKGYKTIPPYFSYEVCADIQTAVKSLPTLQSDFSNLEHACVHRAGSNYQPKKYFSYLVDEAVKECIKNTTEKINKYFTPKGYILEVKKSSDGDLIAKTSLGSKQGVKPGMKFLIYNLRKNNNKIIKCKIAEGTIIHVNNNSSWIIVDLIDNSEIKIGDLVIPVFDSAKHLIRGIWLKDNNKL